MKGTLAYLCVHHAEEGQASYAHVHEIVQGLEDAGWKVRLLKPRRPRRGSLRIVRSLFAVVTLQIRLWIVRPKPDIVYLRGNILALPTIVWARLRRIPTIQEVNGTVEDLFLAYPWTRLFSGVLRGASNIGFRLSTGLIVVTPTLKDIAEHVAPKVPVWVIPNGANTRLYRPGLTAPETLPRPYAMFHGALAPWQGLRVLLVAAESGAWPDEVNLLVAGDGAERSLVQRASERNPRVIYLGEVPYRDIPSILGNSIAGVSVQESLGRAHGVSPLKVFETLACGVPVVVSNVPGQAELVAKHSCGVVVPEGDSEGVAQAIARIWGNRKEAGRMGARGRAAIVREHSWGHRAQSTSDLLSALCEGGNLDDR